MGERYRPQRTKADLKAIEARIVSHVSRAGRIALLGFESIDVSGAFFAAKNSYTLFESNKPLWGVVNVGATIIFAGGAILTDRIRRKSSRRETEFNELLSDAKDDERN